MKTKCNLSFKYVIQSYNINDFIIKKKITIKGILQIYDEKESHEIVNAICRLLKKLRISLFAL